MLVGGDGELDEGSLCVVARSFNTAHWRRLVQFPAGSRRGSIFLCLLYRVGRGETNKECRRPRGRTHAPPLTVASVDRNVPRRAIPDRVRPAENQPQPMSKRYWPRTCLLIRRPT